MLENAANLDIFLIYHCMQSQKGSKWYIGFLDDCNT